MVFCDAAITQSPLIRTAMLVFTRVLRRARRRARSATAPRAWINATSVVRNRNWVISKSSREPRGVGMGAALGNG